MCLLHQDNFALIFLASLAQMFNAECLLSTLSCRKHLLILLLKKCSKNCSVIFTVVNGGKDITCQAGLFSEAIIPWFSCIYNNLMGSPKELILLKVTKAN